MTPVRILIVDDHPLVQRGLKLTLEAAPGFEVTAVVDSGEAAQECLDRADPEVAVVDVMLPGIDGIELTRQLLARRPGLRVLVVSHHDEALYAERAIRAGARGYLSKVEAADQVTAAVRHIVTGRLYLSDDIKDRLVLGSPSGSPLDELSDRELQVYLALGQGQSTRQIADSLALSVKTIETYQQRLKLKLGLESGRELIHHATRWAADPGARPDVRAGPTA